MEGFMKNFVVLLFIILASMGTALAGSAQRNAQPLTLKSQLSDGWLAEYRSELSRETIMLEGKPHLLFSPQGDLDGNPDPTGLPMLPVDLVMLGIPEGATIRVEMLDPVYRTMEQQYVAPWPTYVEGDSDERVAEYRKNAAAFSADRFYPQRQLVIDRPIEYRDQHITSFRLSPYQYNPATKVLRQLVQVTLKITLTRLDGSTMALPPSSRGVSDPFFEETFKQLLWNYEQAKGWRVRHSSNDTPPDPTRDWFETGKPYYKMPVTEDGWYKVTKAQLVAAGAPPNLIDVPTLKVFYKGNQIPIVVRPDTSVEFYGLRNLGDSTYTDFFTDTSAYWLTWGGAAGLRFTPAFVDSVPPLQPFQTAYATLHMEKNDEYYEGFQEQQIVDPETGPLEGWGWRREDQWFYPGTIDTFQFRLDDLATGTFGGTTLRIRLVSNTPNLATPNHLARFWINDSLVGEHSFPGLTSSIALISVSPAFLNRGNNVLRIQSIQTGASVNKFYLDWFEITYAREFRAVQNIVELHRPTSPFQRINFEIQGFTHPQIELYDIRTGRQITSTRIAASGSAFVLTARDSVASARHYVAFAVGAARPVAFVTQKYFTDIRVNAQGADYIVITHRDFLASAQQLATHRRLRNGVRTKVIDVEDIYDEFNYGIMNGTKLKPFMRYAYDNWQAPRPSSLLLFGDACWDFHRFDRATRSINYVPSYGVPVTDDWFVCFNPDSAYLPNMYVGRIPVQNPAQANSVVAKVMGYDSYVLGEWNKNFLFVAGENTYFHFLSNRLINEKVMPPPIGGRSSTVYKTTSGAVSGEQTALMKEIIRNGTAYLNFIGHSGGRIWEVDIGPPSELENTNGMLPFVSSVSCNVGGFANLTNVLAEDFILADNRGSIGSWASSTLGRADLGYILQDGFLQTMRDSIRGFGPLTFVPRVRMLRGGGFYQTIAVRTNNLLGDPLSRFALPERPDLAMLEQDIIISNPAPTTNDSVVTIKVKAKNFGLVPTDSVGIRVTDTYNGTTTILVERKFAPIRQSDSLTIQWRNMHQVGLHTITVSIDPENRIAEVSEMNNTTAKNQYVYANFLTTVKPIRNMVVPPGVQRLVVTSPVGVDSSGFSYAFELDTVDTFDSPALISSGPITPTNVTGEWSTPSLPEGRVYFWRARTLYGTTLGRWVESAFITANDAPTLPVVRWREHSRQQFRRDNLFQATATDSGVTIAVSPLINMFVRSVGDARDGLIEYYSVIKMNELRITGYPPSAGGLGFLAMRLNTFTAIPDFRAFHPEVDSLVQSRRMVNFIDSTQVGEFLAFSVIENGSYGVTESLKVALERLGSTFIRQLAWGDKWVFIGRKGANGPGMVPFEAMRARLDTAAAIVSMQLPSYYRIGTGSITTPDQLLAPSWNSFRWQLAGQPTTTGRIAFLGVRPTATVDTLGIFPRDSTNIDLSFLNTITSGERYRSLRTGALLSTTDATLTPRLTQWEMDLIAPADLAVSTQSIAGAEPAAARNIEVTVYNIGYQDSDSSTVTLAVYDRQNRARQLASVPMLPITVGSSRTVTIPITVTNLSRRVTLQASVIPAKRAKDLVAENNTALYSFINNTGFVASDIVVYSDGTPLMDGDLVSAQPQLMLNMPTHGDQQITQREVRLFVNDRHAGTWTSAAGEVEPHFTPQLPDGNVQLKFAVTQVNGFGEADSLDRMLTVNVSRESRIMEMFNYPNPFATETYFTLKLSGSRAPEELAIRVFTVAGRKIRELRVPSSSLHVGFNRIYWDGRDEQGDELANGYYFYQATMKGEGNVQSEIRKLVKVR